MALRSVVRHLTPVALLAALLCAPPALLERSLGAAFARTTWAATVKPVLQTLTGLGLLRAVNAGLNAWATNHWRLSSQPPGGRWDWPNELAVVTGGCSGIGLALVQGLTARGVRVAVLDVRRPPPALAANARAAFFECDVGSRAAVAAAAAAVRARFAGAPPPSVLVNNAGVARAGSVLGQAEAHLRRAVDVNLLAHWFTAQHFVPAMVARNKGHVVTVASLASFVALSASVEYSATKAGLLAFHEGLACEIRNVHKAPGVVMSVVHPDFVRTAMTIPHADRIEKAQKMMEIDDVAGPILDQIFSGRGGQLCVPERLTILSTLRAWPNWLQEALRDKLGGSLTETPPA